MTLEEYKSQVKEIADASQNFNGTPEESVEFFADLAKKYPQVEEFNTRALGCKDLKEFKNLADAFGMKFSSDDSAEKLFSMLQDGANRFEAAALRLRSGGALNDDDLSLVTGGYCRRAAKTYGIATGCGAGMGGLIGSFVCPGVGTFIGAGVGGAAGLSTGWFVRLFTGFKG